MAKTDIIPAIDILSGKCVRLSQGDYARSTVYNADPVEVALMFEDAGITRLHLVDLDGAREKHIVNYEVLERIALKTKLTIDFGGGLKSGEDLRIAFECGAAMVTGGSIAVREPETFLGWLQHYGPEKILLGADAREGKIAISGWQDTSDTDIIPFITWWVEQGIHTVISTDIARDGMLTGPATDLYREILSHLPGVALIASGGISSMEEIFLLAETGLQGVITGKAIYEGKISLRKFTNTIKRMLAKRIIPCLDIKDGQTVKGIRFVDIRNVGDPVELGAIYAAQGADELVFLDITATHEGRKTFKELVRRIAREINIPFTVGGGISELRDAGELLAAGADKISINSAAVRNPALIDEIASHFGSQFVVLATDARGDEKGHWTVTVNGGRISTEKELFSWALEGENRGAGEILFTSMNHDGTKNGFACDELARLSEQLTIPLIASGGAGSMEHFAEVFTRGKADAGLAASIFHFREIAIPDLKSYLRSQGITVR